MLTVKIFKGLRSIDTVFYSDDFLKGYTSLSDAKNDIKKSLIEHDGYDTDIEIIISQKSY